MLKTWVPQRLPRHASLYLCLFLASCASLPQQISRHVDRGEYLQARALLEKQGVGEYVRKDSKPEALEARRLFTSKIENRYVQEASQLASSGALRSAIVKVDEGIAISPWSHGLVSTKSDLSRRLERVNSILSKWKGATPVGEMPLADARGLLFDLKRIAPDYADTPLLISLRDSAANSVVGEWENRIIRQEKPVTIENSKLFWGDIETVGLDALKSDDCAGTMVLLSSSKIAPEKFTIYHNRDVLLKGASCLGRTSLTGRESALLRMQSISQAWVKRWYQKFIPEIANNENASFDMIDDYESLLKEIPPSMAPDLRRQIGLLHIRAAAARSGAGASAVLSLLHAERAQQLHKSVPPKQVEDLQKRAVASIISGERLASLISIDSDPSINPQLYDLVRTVFMVGIRSRTKNYFSWRFLPPGQFGASKEITIDAVRVEIPSYDELRTVVSEYFSHTESVQNPYKAYLGGMLTSAKIDLDFAKSSYNSAVTSHNIYPTQYSLMNVNNAYNNYVFKLNTYNNYVDLYNAASSTIERPVYMPYSFKQGTVNYGWEVRIHYRIEGQSGTATGKSMESDFVRVGTRYTDKNPSYRRDDDLSFSITLERTIAHLFNAVKMACDQMKSAIAEAVPLRYTSGFTDREIKTAKWFLHPWGSDAEIGRKNGVPEWAIVSASSVSLPEIEYKPTDIFLPALSARPKVPLDASTAAKWYDGLIGEVFAERRGGGQTISTGAVISPDGLILTCAHGLGGEDLRVRFRSGSWAGSYAADIVFVNEDSDVALIRARGLKTKRWIEVRLYGSPEKGEDIVAIGNPSLPDGSQSIEAISKGIVSNSESEFYGVPRLIADITVASGSSGGPLISLTDGKIIGVVVAVADSELAHGPGQRSASGTVCLAAPSIRLKEWLGLKTKRK